MRMLNLYYKYEPFNDRISSKSEKGVKEEV